MAEINNNASLVINGKVAYKQDNAVFPSGTHLDYGYWRGSTDRDFKNSKFSLLYLPFEGSGVRGGKPVVSTPNSNAPQGDNCSSYEAVYQWNDPPGEWSRQSDECADHAECTASPPSYDGSGDGELGDGTCSSSGSGSTVSFTVQGNAEWYKAGATVEQIGNNAVKQRSLLLRDDSRVVLGSGAALPATGGGEFTGYVKFTPSGNITGTTFLSQHKEDPAILIMGCNDEGRFFARTDTSVAGTNTPIVVTSTKKFEQYAYPIHMVTTYASGDSRLKLYVNGQLEGRSPSFSRTAGNNTTNIVLGRSEFNIVENSFVGFVDELGLASGSMTSNEVKSFYDSHFALPTFIDEEVTTPGSGAIAQAGFSRAFDAKDKTHIMLEIDGTNSEGAAGGAFDIWGHSTHAISSQISFPIKSAHANLHQVKDVFLDIHVENRTNHPSGAILLATFENENDNSYQRNMRFVPTHATRFRENTTAVSGIRNVKGWRGGALIPSGFPELVTFSGVLADDLYFQGGKSLSYKEFFEEHKLNLSVFYEDTGSYFDGEFKIYSSKVRFSSYDRFYSFNTASGDFQNTGQLSPSLTLKTFGASAVSSSGSTDLFVNATTAAQSMDLLLYNPFPLSSLGHSGTGHVSGVPTINTSNSANLFTIGGVEIRTLQLFLKRSEVLSSRAASVNLMLQAGKDLVPSLFNTAPLYLNNADRSSGSISGAMNMVLPNVGGAGFQDYRLLFIKGLQPVSNIPLYLRSNEPVNKSLNLLVRNSGVYSFNDNMNLFLKHVNIFGGSSMHGFGTLGRNNNMNLATSGHAVVTSNTTLFVKPFASGTGSETLYVRGYQ